ncbi:FAR-17a/AIG1-like protein-domain-containing protein [Ampelomyces quisqualis]|uniref:FAR-17a/AIG1-like protein-domain-containing protein n=1 Tax=Ampelomyces quisqualis TaxID=50730 RepID=A0A6A5QW42_AMPQU|nr:FAR-17a/AIG1-like protein-domain-containing protein [Ampelomyces quisqualis]
MSPPAASAVNSSQRHPLQRCDSPSKGFSGALHSCRQSKPIRQHIPTPPSPISQNNPSKNDSFGWHLQFLTILGITICTVCFTLGLLADTTCSTTLFTLKNYISLIATPLEIVISILYWGLRALDTTLVVPADHPLPALIPDLGFHFFPALFTTLDTMLLSPPWPSSPANPQAPLLTLALSAAVALLYWVWIETCFAYNGFYPYPVFQLLTTVQRLGLFAVSAATMWVAAGALRVVYAWLNGFETLEQLDKAGRAKSMGERRKWE